MKKVLIAVVLVTFTGCASEVQRGVVAMKINDHEAHVGIGSQEVHVGDHVELYRNDCQTYSAGERNRTKTCKKVAGGHGEVTEILNDDYSVVKFPQGTTFSEGDMIERHRH